MTEGGHKHRSSPDILVWSSESNKVRSLKRRPMSSSAKIITWRFRNTMSHMFKHYSFCDFLPLDNASLKASNLLPFPTALHCSLEAPTKQHVKASVGCRSLEIFEPQLQTQHIQRTASVGSSVRDSAG